jgi:hypothetical protein
MFNWLQNNERNFKADRGDWRADSTNTCNQPVKKIIEKCLESGLLRNFKGTIKIKGKVKKLLKSVSTCPILGLLNQIIIFREMTTGERVPLKRSNKWAEL